MAKIGIQIEAQEDLTWDKWHLFADKTEALGFESLWRSDHLLPLVLEPKKEVLEAWVSFATLASRTKRIRFGPMVSPMTFRHPSLLAKMAASIDHLSGGRLELGLGAGWNVAEHHAFGIPFYDWRTRFGMLEEGLQVIDSLWTKDNVTFNGKFYNLDNATCYPKPIQNPRPPFIIGGNGERRTLPLAASYADEWNADGLTVEEFKAKRDLLYSLCEKAGRDTNELKCSLLSTVVIGKDQNDLTRRQRRVASILSKANNIDGKTPSQLVNDHGWIVGSSGQVVEQMQAFAEAGVQRFILQLYDYDDTEVLDLLARDVQPNIDRV